MKKTKYANLIILGLVLFLPFITVSPAQESYVGVQDGSSYLWKLSLYSANWERYFVENLEGTLGNLFPSGPYANMTQFYLDWFSYDISPPQSNWPFNVIDVGIEQTGLLLSPFDNTSITSTSVFATAGYKLNGFFGHINSFYNGTWYIVNDTSSFLRQTLNLTFAFSPYGIMGVPFAPKTINWTSFITEFLGVMKSKGGLYDNISAVANSNGYTLNIPALGFESNLVPIEINVKYNSNGVLTSYAFSYGGKMLGNYWLYIPPLISTNDLNTIIVGVVVMSVIVLFVVIMRKITKKPIYVGSV